MREEAGPLNQPGGGGGLVDGHKGVSSGLLFCFVLFKFEGTKK